MAAEIDRREDVNPNEGLREYGDVEFADPTNHKYPIDTPEHVRAAWSYINRRDDVSPKEGLREYGDVEFADPTNHKYPIDTPEHVRAAWSYIKE